MKKLYGEYSFFVMPSRYEGLPMVLLEAKHNYLPCISFDINYGPGELIRDGVNGILVKPGDIEVLAEAICDMIEHPEQRQTMSQNSQIDMEKYTKHFVSRQWQELLGL